MRRFSLGIVALTSSTLLFGCENLTTSPKGEASTSLSMVEKLPMPSVPSNGRLTPAQFVKLVTFADESVRSQALEVDISAQNILSAQGAFEPEFYAELNRTGERRQTTAEQLSSAVGSADPYWSYTSEGEFGVALKSKAGISLNLYVEMSRVANSLQQSANLSTPEYSAKSGVSVEIPLLKGAGEAVNTAQIRIAKIDQEIAKNTVDLVKSKRAYEGLRTYTAYQRALARVATRQESYGLTQALAKEIRTQLDGGFGVTPSDLTAARGRVAESKSALTQAKIELAEKRDALQLFFVGLPEKSTSKAFLPASGLSVVDGRKFKIGSLNQIYTRRPEIKVQSLEIERKEIESLVADNQRKSELNLKLDFAKTQLSGDYMPFRDLFNSNNPYETWRIGFEYRRGLWGNKTGEAEYKAANLREKQAELTMNAFRQRLAGEVTSMSGIVARARESLASNKQFYTSQTRLVRDEINSENAGIGTQIDVLTRKLEAVLAREARNDSIAQLNQAYHLAAYVNGTLLDVFGVQ